MLNPFMVGVTRLDFSLMPESPWYCVVFRCFKNWFFSFTAVLLQFYNCDLSAYYNIGARYFTGLNILCLFTLIYGRKTKRFALFVRFLRKKKANTPNGVGFLSYKLFLSRKSCLTGYIERHILLEQRQLNIFLLIIFSFGNALFNLLGTSLKWFLICAAFSMPPH